MSEFDDPDDEVFLAQITARLGDRFEGRSVLVVEDEIGIEIEEVLREAGFAHVRCAPSIAAARKALADESFDICVLDRGLPDGDGIALLKLLRSDAAGLATAHDTPCLIYSMLDRTQEKVSGLIEGASDYLAKSGGEAELLARLANQLPFRDEAEDDGFSILPLEVDEAAMVVSAHGEPLQLTTLEAAVFVEIWKARGQPVPKTALWERCWMGHAGWSHFSPRWENCMEKAISRLRMKIRAQCPFLPESHLPLIVTWRATGFAMRNLAGLSNDVAASQV